MKLISFIRRQFGFSQRTNADVDGVLEDTDTSPKAERSTVSDVAKNNLEIQVRLRFKNKRQKEEWPKLDERVQAILLWTAYVMRRQWNFQAVVTSVGRTQAEQDLYQRRGWTQLKRSPHQYWRAADISLKKLPDKYRHGKVIKNKINKTWPRTDGKPTAWAHGEGPQFHLHIQVPA